MKNRAIDTLNGGARVLLILILFVNCELDVLASYRVVFKDGHETEALAKPVIMESQYLIRGIDNHTYSVPVHQVNLPATESANQPKMQQVVSQTSTLAASPPLPSQPPVGVLANKDILEMHKMGLGPEILLAKIKSSPSQFDTSPSALQELKAAGLSDAVILAVVQSTAAPTVPTPPRSSATSVSSQPTSKQTMVLNDGTPLKLRLNRNVSSADAKEGESVDFEVLEDVSV